MSWKGHVPLASADIQAIINAFQTGNKLPYAGRCVSGSKVFWHNSSTRLNSLVLSLNALAQAKGPLKVSLP
jgi:hypothetical protein